MCVACVETFAHALCTYVTIWGEDKVKQWGILTMKPGLEAGQEAEMPRDRSDPGSNRKPNVTRCLLATEITGVWLRGSGGLTLIERREDGHDPPWKTRRGLSVCMFTPACLHVCSYCPCAGGCFTLVQMTFHSIMKNVPHFIKPSYMWESSLEAKKKKTTTFVTSNESQSPWLQMHVYMCMESHRYTRMPDLCMPLFAHTSGHYATADESV